MRALLVHNRYQQAGGEDAVYANEGALLADHGHEVERFEVSNRSIASASVLGSLPAAAGAMWSRSGYRSVLRMIDRVRPDVVHFHNTFPLISPSAYYAARSRGVPVVQTLHNFRLLCPGATLFREGRPCEDCVGKVWPWPSLVHRCYRGSLSATAVSAGVSTLHRLLGTWTEQVDIFLTMTEFGRQKFVQGGLPADKLFVKPHFLPSDPGVRSGSGQYALFVGRLSPEKGLSTLLRAWTMVPEIPLKIIGDGPLGNEVRQFVEAERLDTVELLGWRSRDEVMACMKEARFLLFPSEWYETFGLTMIEAFACGVPVLASALGAAAEIVQDGLTGWHHAPGDAADLAVKAAWAWAHPKESAAMGQMARAAFASKYSAERNYQLLMDLYGLARERARERVKT